MTNSTDRSIYFSFFMFTANLQPDNPQYTKVLIDHIKALTDYGYAGFDLPIAPGSTLDHRGEIESYKRLRDAFDAAGLGGVGFTTNVAATRTFNPSSPYAEQRQVGLDYLKSRVDISKALRASIMAGPIVLPYGVYPTTDFGDPIWSDALQDWLAPRYRAAQPVIEALGDYAAGQGIKVAIEPVDHWETPAPNLVKDVMNFLHDVSNPQVGVCIDSAHVVLGSDGPEAFAKEVERVLNAKRLHYVHISAPDRGKVHDSWIPWKTFLPSVLKGYDGPFLIEVFNGIPVFLNSLRITRREFWLNAEETSEPGRLSAYEVAQKGIEALKREL